MRAKGSLIPRRFPPPFFGRMQLEGKAWEIWSCAVTAGGQRADTHAGDSAWLRIMKPFQSKGWRPEHSHKAASILFIVHDAINRSTRSRNCVTICLPNVCLHTWPDLPDFRPPYLHTASDHGLEVGTARKQPGNEAAQIRSTLGWWDYKHIHVTEISITDFMYINFTYHSQVSRIVNMNVVRAPDSTAVIEGAVQSTLKAAMKVSWYYIVPIYIALPVLIVYLLLLRLNWILWYVSLKVTLVCRN